MNLCFVLGKVVSNIDYQFVYDNKKNTSIVLFELLLKNNSILPCKAYNEIADTIYSKIKNEKFILLEGVIEKNGIQVRNIEKWT